MTQSAVTGSNEESFTSKIDIVMVSTRRYRNMIDTAAVATGERHGGRTVLTAIGIAGIGKTRIPMQAARDRKGPIFVLPVPKLGPEDFFVPTSAADTKLYYDRRIPRGFQEILEHVDKMRKDPKLAKAYPIILLDEINRARSTAVTNCCFTLCDQRKIGDVYIPDEVQILATMNPSGGGFTVNEVEKDPAWRRRLLFVGVTASFGDFIAHARKAKYHPKVVEHLESQPTWMYDMKAMQAGKQYCCPASWETVSDICYQLEAQDIALAGQEAKAFFAGKIGLTATEAFVDFIENATVVITPKDVLQTYKESSTVRDRVKKLIDDSRNDALINLCTGIASHIFDGSNKPPKSYGAQLALFMADLPEDVMIAFIKDHMRAQSETVDGGKDYFNALSRYMNQEKDFKVAMERLVGAQRKAQAAANKAAT